MAFAVLIYSSVERKPTRYGRVVELVDSLDSGSSVHCGRAGSSPASPTKRKGHPSGCPFSFLYRQRQNMFLLAVCVEMLYDINDIL